MLGINYIKFDSMTYVIHYKNGKVKREGRGLSFFYFGPSSSIVAIPSGSKDIQFIFNETTADFQTVTIQGQIVFKIENPKQLAQFLDFTVDEKGEYLKEDLEKLNQRIVNEAQTATTAFAQSKPLKEALRASKQIEAQILQGLDSSSSVDMLGIKPLTVNVVGISATPEMARALEAETREALQQEADQAIYERRNFGVEQERRIKESELNTEIAVEEKQKQIAEKKMEREQAEEENRRKIREMKIEADISIEEKRKSFIDLLSENEKKSADSKGYALRVTLDPYKDIDWRTLMAINPKGIDASSQIALAFRELAENAQQINTLNITPDLLDSLIQNK